MNRIETTLGTIRLKNPIMNASGTFNPSQSNRIFAVKEMGAIVVKTISSTGWEGNPQPRVVEIPGYGMLNSIGLQNPGAEYFVNTELPVLSKLNDKIIVSIAGHSIADYINVAKKLKPVQDFITAVEVNLSCPNVDCGGLSFGISPDDSGKIISSLKEMLSVPLWAKLTPNITDITPVAKATVEAGAETIVLINTVLGLSIDIKKAKPRTNRPLAGYSGPAIKPIALRFVWQVYEALPHVPIIGVGGISTMEDVIEFLMAGASAVQIGSANFHQPDTMITILKNLDEYLEKENITSVKDLVGIAHR